MPTGMLTRKIQCQLSRSVNPTGQNARRSAAGSTRADHSHCLARSAGSVKRIMIRTARRGVTRRPAARAGHDRNAWGSRPAQERCDCELRDPDPEQPRWP
jgi:hypothetical protein